MQRMKPELMSDDEIWKLFQKSERIPEEEFDALYNLVAAYLNSKGGFSGDGLKEGFSGSRWVDPVATLTIVSSVPITQSLAEGLVVELRKLEGLHAVIFDGIDGASCVTSDGRFLREKR